MSSQIKLTGIKVSLYNATTNQMYPLIESTTTTAEPSPEPAPTSANLLVPIKDPVMGTFKLTEGDVYFICFENVDSFHRHCRLFVNIDGILITPFTINYGSIDIVRETKNVYVPNSQSRPLIFSPPPNETTSIVVAVHLTIDPSLPYDYKNGNPEIQSGEFILERQ